MVLNTLTVVITVVVLRLYHADPRVPPPAWLRVVVHRCLARMVCKRLPTNIAVGSESEHKAFTLTECDFAVGYDVRDTVSRQANDRKQAERSPQEVRRCKGKKDIVSECKFMAEIIDAFFARCFFLTFVVVVVLLFCVTPLVLEPYIETVENRERK